MMSEKVEDGYASFLGPLRLMSLLNQNNRLPIRAATETSGYG